MPVIKRWEILGSYRRIYLLSPIPLVQEGVSDGDAGSGSQLDAAQVQGSILGVANSFV